MKLRTLLLLSSAAYAASALPAHAGIESLIAAAIQGFLLSSTTIAATATGAIATVAANVIIGGAVLGASILLGGAQRGAGAIKPSDAKSTFETGESSVIELAGRGRMGGLQAFGNTDGSTRARLVCRAVGPVGGTENFYLGGREVTVEENGDVSSPPWARPGGSWANWQNKLGTGAETAWAGLMSLFPTLWTSAHRVRGIAQSQLLFYNPGIGETKYLSLYQSGAPNSEEVMRGSLIYDARDGTQDADTVSTWKWSDNGPLYCAHVLRRDPAFSEARFNWTKIAATADIADTLVATKTGTEKRSRIWGPWAWESERGATMQQFLDSAGLEIRMDEDGKIYFDLIDDDITPEIDFTPRDMYDFSWQSGPEAVERPNTCRIKYYSPERNYELSDINMAGIAWAVVQDEVDRYGPKYFDLELPFCPSASQAQRIARRKFALARADRGRMITNMVGLAAWGLLYAEIEEPDTLDVSKVRIDPPRIDDENGSVEIPFTTWPTLSPWNPAADEADAPEVIPELGYETNIITPDAPTAALQITYPDGDKEMRIGFTLPVQEFDVVEANYRTYTSGLPNPWQGMTEFGNVCAYVPLDLIGQPVDARVRVFDGDDGSYFSPVASLTVVASNTACGAPTTVSGGVDPDPITPRLNVVVKATELRCASIRLRRRANGGAYSTVEQVDARPEQNVTFVNNAETAPSDVTDWQIQTLTSNGTVGTSLNFTYSEPPL